MFNLASHVRQRILHENNSCSISQLLKTFAPRNAETSLPIQCQWYHVEFIIVKPSLCKQLC